jgi:hypothetical protein
VGDDDSKPISPDWRTTLDSAPEKLEYLTLYDGCMHRALAPLFASCTQLVVLHLSKLQDTDYNLVERVIRASSQSLRSISMYDLAGENSHGDAVGRRLLQAVSSCTLVRFLQLGSPVLGNTNFRKHFELLARLPIEFLGVRSLVQFSDELIDSLSLFPKLLAINLYHLSEDSQLVRSKFDSLPVVFEHILAELHWPPLFEELSPRAQELFRDRPYRTSCSPISRPRWHVD